MNINNILLSRNSLAKLLSLSPRRINQLSQKGIVSKESHGKYNMLESLHGYLYYLRNEEFEEMTLNPEFVELEREYWTH